MRLAEFIQTHIEQIVVEWEAFARTIGPGGAMSNLALRDHAEDILRAAVRDMQSAQTAHQRSEKSRGHGESGPESSRLDRASSVHAVDRVASGFDLLEVVSEYRAMRASVLRLWRASDPHANLNDIDDITRFNESIDQSLTEAVRSFTKRVDQSRQMFLAILAHDLRNPLNSIMMSAQAVSRSESSEELTQISSSAEVIARLISELIDFAGTGLGGTLPVAPAPTDLGQLCREVCRELQAGQPAASVEAAKAIAQREKFDLVVSDLGLPDGTGHELMGWLKEHFGLVGIALSGYGMEEDIRRSREAGFSEHLIKPLNPEQFEAALGRVMGNGRSLESATS